MQPTPVRVGLMDSRRPGLVVLLPALVLGRWRRAWRALGRLVGVSLACLVVENLAIVAIPFPTIHLCTLPVALVVGPIAAGFAWYERVLFGRCEVRCPRCAEPVAIPARLAGWPARRTCGGCGIMVELTPP